MCKNGVSSETEVIEYDKILMAICARGIFDKLIFLHGCLCSLCGMILSQIKQSQNSKSNLVFTKFNASRNTFVVCSYFTLPQFAFLMYKCLTCYIRLASNGVTEFGVIETCNFLFFYCKCKVNTCTCNGAVLTTKLR